MHAYRVGLGVGGGLVILGGLITATLLNLFVVPSLYLRFAKKGGVAGTPMPAAPMPA